VAGISKEKLMNKAILLAFLPALLIGCGSSPEEAVEVEETAEVDVVDPNGMYTGVSQFVDVTDITAIDTGLIRLNMRHDIIFPPHQDRIQGARILDLGSYDGRFTYAALKAGAQHVTGIEIEPAYAAKAATNLRELGFADEQYDFIVDDIMKVLKKIEPGTYDGVICAGIYYHITYHVALMAEFKRLGIKWIIMDTTVLSSDEPIIKWVDGPHGMNRLEGIPSRSAIEMIAAAVGYKYEYVPVDHLTSKYMWDYRKGNHISMLIYE
jgi:hypothetical protein